MKECSVGKGELIKALHLAMEPNQVGLSVKTTVTTGFYTPRHIVCTKITPLTKKYVYTQQHSRYPGSKSVYIKIQMHFKYIQVHILYVFKIQ
jgi:hypothetical protein